MLKSVSQFGAFLLSLLAADLAYGDVPQPCSSCGPDWDCIRVFGYGWYYCGTDPEGYWWCCPS